jgi:uncharacterized protein
MPKRQSARGFSAKGSPRRKIWLLHSNSEEYLIMGVMPSLRRHSRRTFLKTGTAALGAAATANLHVPLARAAATPEPLLTQLPYSDVALTSEPHERQLRETHAVLMSLNEDSMLRPLRAMADMPTPGASLGGWYAYNPDYDPPKDNPGFAPAHAFGQWVSALARYYAITGDSATREKVLRLTGLYRQTISAGCYTKTRFPAYNYDKYVCMLMDAHSFARDPNAWEILAQTTDTALPHLPTHAIPRLVSWRAGTDDTYTWDESYTMPENLFLAAERGAGSRYHQMAFRYLEDEDYFEPLSRGVDAMAGRHAYSHVNALCSAMQAWMAGGSAMHLSAAKHGFDLLDAQSYATGGWGPDETLRRPESDDLYRSLSKTHSSFETPCGSYAHTKLTRYLIRVTRDGRYGDSMERVVWNTVLGAKPLERDGRAFYYSDYNNDGHRRYHPDAFPCCSGTLPQVSADYRINSYLRDADGLYVVLYMPSSVGWEQDGAKVALSQQHSYPLDSELRMLITTSRPQEFSLRLRIPAWAGGATLAVNGKQVPMQMDRGFATLRRRWASGDRIDLHLPIENLLVPINAHHPETVALMRGPLVLFPLGQEHPPVTRQQLQAAQRTGPDTWKVDTAKGTIQFVPFTSIGDRAYSTYLAAT